MVYANVVLTAGAEQFALRAAAAGAAGLIVPDLPHDEAGELRGACDAEGLALVPLVAPTTTPERVAEIGADARGFVYTVSLGGHHRRARRAAARAGGDRRAACAAATDLPVAVGFGISTAEQARAVAEIADGVIVGSRVVRAAGEGGAGGRGRAGGRARHGASLTGRLAADHGRDRRPTVRPTTAKAVEERRDQLLRGDRRRDVEAIGEHWREDGVDDIVPIGVLRGRGEIEGFFRGLFAAVPDLETTVVRVVPGDRVAAVEWRMSGTFTGEPFQGIEPTGKAVELRGVDLFEVEDVRSWETRPTTTAPSSPARSACCRPRTPAPSGR